MMGLPLMISSMGFAPVGLGWAFWTQPMEAQEPHATTAFASLRGFLQDLQ
jgi:hypothetical protein